MLHFPPWKIVLVCFVCALGVLFALPNLVPRSTLDELPSWLPHKQINLGLDLQGGSHLLLQVDTATIAAERLETLQDDIRDILRAERLGVRVEGVINQQLIMTLRSPDDVEAATDALSDVDNTVNIAIDADGRITASLSEAGMTERISNAVNQSIEILRRRLDGSGVREPTIQRQGTDRIIVQLPGISDPTTIDLDTVAKLTFQMIDQDTPLSQALAGNLPAGSEVLDEVLDQAAIDAGAQPRQYVVRKRVMVSGEHLTDAQPSFDQGRPVVSFAFDNAGARRFCDATTENIDRQMAIILDDKVISAPRINGPICQGRGIITGSFTVEGSNRLALLLRAGALPAPLIVLEERTVGPSLGADSVHAGEFAAVIGLAAVVVFMAMSYGLFGMFANVALIANIILIGGALSLLQATLTLPGIAGIVLTIGMAVDANVLVFERIREEVANGRTPFNAVDSGYQRALGTIIDSNLTTFIAAALLYSLGDGPVKGFGVTLAIGLMTSMFTATMVTRLITVLWLRRRRPQVLPV
jgi:preprotein translocase subunit SecD